nr:antichymotrypsin-2-like [Limnephilus flavicornis]
MRLNQITFVVLMLMVSSTLSQLYNQQRYDENYPPLRDTRQQNRGNKRPQYNQPTNSDGVYFPGNDGNPGGPSASGAAVSENNDKKQQVLADTITKFSLDMTKKLLEEEDGNLVVSPASVAAVLSLLYQGVADPSKTATELQNTLGLERKQSKNAFRTFINTLKGGPAGRDMIFANAVFVEGSQLEPEFKKIAANAFNAEIINTRFNNPVAASSTINDWVKIATKGKIPSLVEPGGLDSTTKCVLTNAVFFKNVWKNVFDDERTIKKQFHINSGDGVHRQPKSVEAEFMHQSVKMVAGSNKTFGARWIKIPFDDNVYSMFFVLPLEQDGIDAVVRKMQPEDLKSILETKTIKTCHIGVPKFKIGYSKSLVNALTKMGAGSIFEPHNRDLSKIVQNQPIYVSDALQKAVISIDEQGATAAAATAITVNTLSLASYYDEVRFLADQPFLVIIAKDTTPMFMAKIKDPSLTA